MQQEKGREAGQETAHEIDHEIDHETAHEIDHEAARARHTRVHFPEAPQTLWGRLCPVRCRGGFAFALLGLAWGANFLFMKRGAVWVTPNQVVFLRILFGFTALFLFALCRGELHWRHLRYWYHFLAMSMLSATLCYYFYVRGAMIMNSGVAGMISGTVPLFAFVIAVLVLRCDTLTLRKGIGVLLGLAGTILIAQPWHGGGHPGPESVTGWGTLYLLAGSLSLGASFVYAKKCIAPLGIPPTACAAYQFGFALICIAAVTPMRGIAQIAADPGALFGVVVGLGIVGTGIAYILYYFVIQTFGAVAAASVTYLPPVVALLIGWYVGEPFSWIDPMAMACILAGVFVLQTTPTPVSSRRK